MSRTDHAYLSILSWPNGFRDDQKIEAIVAAAGIDPPQARLAIKRPTPCVICAVDAMIADEVLRVFHKFGVLALAPTQTQFANYAQPETPNSVEVFPESELAAFAVRTRDGGAWTFQAPELRMVVYGKSRSVSSRVRTETTLGSSYAVLSPHAAAIGQAIDGDLPLKHDRSMSVKPMLDLHIEQLLPNGGIAKRLVRLRGSRTRIGLIGDGDPRPSLLDQTHPVDEIRRLAPDAQYDLGFDRFSPPTDPQYRSCHGGSGQHRLSGDSFAFYSVWVALMDEMLYG